MYRLPTIVIQYENEIDSRAITFFRGAIIASLAKKDILFHNHEEDKLRYSYPLIQYKRIHGKAAVMGIGKGIEVLTPVLNARESNCQIGNEEVEMRVEAVNACDNEITLADTTDSRYRLYGWLPLNAGNYRQYQESEGIVERIQILERVLIGNILSFLKGVGIHLEKQIALHITDIIRQHPYIYKDVRLMAFDIEFKTNISLPQYIGLGKNASVGCGVILKITSSPKAE